MSNPVLLIERYLSYFLPPRKQALTFRANFLSLLSEENERKNISKCCLLKWAPADDQMTAKILCRYKAKGTKYLATLTNRIFHCQLSLYNYCHMICDIWTKTTGS